MAGRKSGAERIREPSQRRRLCDRGQPSRLPGRAHGVLRARRLEYAILRWLGGHLNAIFIDRFNPDLKSMREMMKRMEEGQTLVIAPEGTRARDEKMAQGKPGAAYLASKMGWTIVPVAISGSEDRLVLHNLKRFKRTPIRLVAGKPFTLPSFPKENREERLQEYTDEIMCRIAAMLPEHNRGYYANHPRLKELLEEKS
ncbi:MAG: 1-acyl-sn-glycerol-3-phosphate acyltransferase [Anaerolineales bacterium]|nr:1-acyl-sn-glycerol-3-phosphate acyltransferase [Anaerolineales bacterium]